MKNINKAQLLGHLGADPVIRDIGQGRMAQFRLATSDQWKDRTTGERQERTEWHTVELWIPTMVDLAERYLRKGSRVYIEGQIQTRKWQDKDGNDRWTTSVSIRPFTGCLIMLDARREEGGGGYGPGSDPAAAPARSARGAGNPASFDDDDIPF